MFEKEVIISIPNFPEFKSIILCRDSAAPEWGCKISKELSRQIKEDFEQTEEIGIWQVRSIGILNPGSISPVDKFSLISPLINEEEEILFIDEKFIQNISIEYRLNNVIRTLKQEIRDGNL